MSFKVQEAVDFEQLYFSFMMMKRLNNSMNSYTPTTQLQKNITSTAKAYYRLFSPEITIIRECRFLFSTLKLVFEHEMRN